MLREDANADLVGGGRYPDWMRQIDEWREAEPLKFQDTDRRHPAAVRHPAGCTRSSGTAASWTSTIITHRASASTRCGRPSSSTFNQPRKWVTSGGLGTMGFGLPAAIGAKVAHPDNLVIDIDGDGSFLMNMQELATATPRRSRPRCCC